MKNISKNEDALRLLEEAKKQYEEYYRINNVALVAKDANLKSTSFMPPSFQHPLNQAHFSGNE